MTKIFEKPFNVAQLPVKHSPEPIDHQISEAMRQAGIDPPKSIEMDGRIHRFNNGKKRDKSGWYIFYGDGIPAGRFGDWREGVEVTFKADIGRQLTVAEEMAHTRRIAEAKAIREKELKQQHDTASSVCGDIWNAAGLADPAHPYLAKKGIEPHGSRVTGDGRLMVPLMDGDGNIRSLQYISKDGGKLYHKSGETRGNFWLLGVPEQRVYFAEGFATAATIYEATGHAVVVCYSASNIVPVVGEWRERLGELSEFIIVADNDASGTGQKYADQAAAKHGARVIIPPTEGDANDYAQAGHNLLDFLEPVTSDDWLIPADDFCAQPAPLKWLVKHWLQDMALIMVHGPSGGGKTFCVLDWCLRISSGVSEWRGHKVAAGDVVYLAGEGHHGLRGRIAAWKQENSNPRSNMWLSPSGCDLNTNEGYTKVVENVKALPRKPSLIVVDTLHRFLNGDENSAQDAKTMLDACGALMLEFGCAVLLVHHTGVSEEAQHRARGSSAWRGALDIEISITPNKAGGITLSQKKAKDSEQAQDVFAELKSVLIKGWLDEDGKPVTSAVVIEGVEPTAEKKESKLAGYVKYIERAFHFGGCEVIDGKPYVARSALMEMLLRDGKTEGVAKNYTKPSYENGPVAQLINGGIIKPELHGWVVLDQTISSALLVQKNG